MEMFQPLGLFSLSLKNWLTLSLLPSEYPVFPIAGSQSSTGRPSERIGHMFRRAKRCSFWFLVKTVFCHFASY